MALPPWNLHSGCASLHVFTTCRVSGKFLDSSQPHLFHLFVETLRSEGHVKNDKCYKATLENCKNNNCSYLKYLHTSVLLIHDSPFIVRVLQCIDEETEAESVYVT